MADDEGRDERSAGPLRDPEERNRHVMDRALEGAAAETVQRFGAAAKEHLVAYSGVDNETGEQFARSLKTVAGQRVHPDFAKQNIKQQAGFSAEMESTARRNAKNIIDGKGERFKRFDDVPRADGSKVANDQLVDIVSFDEFGNMIPGSRAQMKFVGGSARELLSALKSDKYKKYRDENVLMDIPDDYYDVLMGDGPDGIDAQINKLRHKLDEGHLADGSSDKVRQEIDKLRSIKKSLRKSGLTKSESIEARLYPKLMVAKDIAKLSHKAGAQQAKTGAMVGGGVSLVRNLVGCVTGVIEPAEAAKNVGKDTALAAAFSYVTAFSGTAIKGAMQNASSGYVRSLSKTNVASTLVSATADVSKAISRYCRGEITGAQCVEQMGQQGLGQLGALMGTAVAMSTISAVGATGLVSVAAGMAGSTIGYTAAMSVYEELSTALNEYELAKEERIRVERECAEAVKLIRQYRIEMNNAVDTYLSGKAEAFNAGFEAMDQALVTNDINGYLAGNAAIQEAMGCRPQFHTQQEFDDLMDSDDDFIL